MFKLNIVFFPIHTHMMFSIPNIRTFSLLKHLNVLFMFQDFVQNLSVLSRGSLDEKLRWAFTLYDINGDGCITREEMTDIVTAVYDLMGKVAEPSVDEDTVKERVDSIFQVFYTLPSFFVPHHVRGL